ncbi:MAG: NAD-binding protein [Candidatus Methanoperedens sp.]|nr:NAD-binding protein [Candidatus Methanoperedens sp.]
MTKKYILIGFGDVGRSISSVLEKAHVGFVVVDKNEAKLKDRGFNYFVGNGTDEGILIKAGLKYATTVIIVLNNDDDIIFATLIARNINPHCIILARANTTKSIDKIYRAGADYVASLSIVAGQMLAHIAIGHQQDSILMLEGLEIGKHRITRDSHLAGKSIADAGIRSRIGCTIIGIEVNGKTSTDIDPSIILREGMTLAVIGNSEQISKFKEEYSV